ncbi:MAG TPA: T9SS type A sorting domain-containing protein, partial [Flavobacteriales bacterium]|nr:T9SS type A sorting domain-containing protein [Flavobacteriales bacterium]
LLDTTNLFAYLDSVHALVQHAQERHFRKWQLLGVSGAAPEVLAVASTYAAELDTLKHWIRLRLDWLDTNMPGLCSHVGMNESLHSTELKVFPNPSEGIFRFQGSVWMTHSSTLLVTDITGREISRTRIPSGRIEGTVELNMPGAYLYSIIGEGRLLHQGKLIVQ